MIKSANLQDILQQLTPPFSGEIVFDCLTDSVFFIKDSRGRYLSVNQTLVQRCGLLDKSELLGKTPTEVLGRHLATGYEAQDKAVIATGQAITKKLELHHYPNRKVGWCLTNKFPFLDSSGAAVGLVGISQDLRLPNLSSDDYEHVAAAVRYAEKHIADAPTVDDMSAAASMSPYRLDKRLRRVFGLTAGQLMLKQRIDFAQRQLSDSNLPIATVALNSGYADQSAFTRQFRLTTGMSPSAFRRASNRRGQRRTY
ncbi:MAG: AraC family transcriptional regulator [Proteobacteria bacterium]|nr:AraC family transcriptional regulator [Pseudomonadota bacterium]